MKKTAFAILLLFCALLLTGCYQDRDPWPASDRYTQTEPDHTLIPRTTVTPVPVSVTTAPTAAPVQPTLVPRPTSTPVMDLWDAGPTEVPGGSVEPGFNG